jgi:hypothetical protein
MVGGGCGKLTKKNTKNGIKTFKISILKSLLKKDEGEVK